MVNLVARTRRLDDDVDLLAVAGDDGVLWTRGRDGLAGRGEAAWVVVPPGDSARAAEAVTTAMEAIEVDDEVGLPGCGPVAMGVLPFDPELPGRLIVPATVVGRAPDGTRWVTWCGPPDRSGSEPLADFGPTAAAPSPSAYTVRSDRHPDDWQADVAVLAARLRAERDRRDAGDATATLRKVVLARALTVEADVPISPAAVLARLRDTYPGCMLFRTAGEHVLVGASPELLVARIGDIVRSHPLAGTAPRSGDPSADARLAGELIASTKDREEHRVTIDMVHDTLLPYCSFLDEEAEPSVVAMANVQHLGTVVEGRLLRPPAHVIELVRALHPTPAVGGVPRDAALATIAELEQLDRGAYAGPVGWVDARGNGEWAVGIRCAELDGCRARLYAGVGVLPDSEPEAELAETRAKLQAVLSAVLRP